MAKFPPFYMTIPKNGEAAHVGGFLYVVTGRELLHLHIGTGFLQLGGDVVGLCFGNAFLYVLRGAIDQVLGFLQTEAGQVFYDLYNSQLVGTTALQDHIEGGLLFSNGSSSSRTCSYSNSSSGGLNSVLVLQDLGQFVNFFHGEVHQLFGECL